MNISQQNGDIEDDDDLWDELNHQQSKEIQQHQYKINMSTKRKNTTATVIRDAIQQTTAVLSSAASAAATGMTSKSSSYHHQSNKSSSSSSSRIKYHPSSYPNNLSISSSITTTSSSPNMSTGDVVTGPSNENDFNDADIEADRLLRANLSEFGLASSSHSTKKRQKRNDLIPNSSKSEAHPLQLNCNTNPPQPPYNHHPSSRNVPEHQQQHTTSNFHYRNLNPSLETRAVPSTNNTHNSTNDTTSSLPLLANDYQNSYHLETGRGGGRMGLHDSKLQNNKINRDTGSIEGAGGGIDFIFLRKFRIMPKSDGWGAVPNLDLFFTSIYNYYYHRGITIIIGKGIVEIISLFFTLCLSVFLFAYIDWASLAKCQDASSCRGELKDYIIEKPLSTLSLRNSYVVLYCIIFTCYGISKVFSFLVAAQDAAEAKIFFEDKLGISQRELEGGCIEWDTIVQKVIKLQETGEHRISINGQNLDALVVAHRILRKENFLVAFFNNQVLDLRVPLPWLLSSSGRSKNHYLSKSLEWSIHLCIFSYMFNHKYQITPEFHMGPSALRRRFILCGVAQAFFMPFLLIFMLLHFFFLNVHDFQSSREYLGPKEWSNIAKWTFREFNELPHAFERRLAPSYESAEEYLKLFTKSPVMICFGQIVVFLSGSILAVLLAFATINDSILLHVQLSNWNLLWYVGIFGGIFSAGRSLLPDKQSQRVTHRNLFQEMDTALKKVSLSTHYLPETWRKRGWEKTTQSQFSEMYQVKAQLFALEVLSVIFAPFVLMISLPKCANEICAFVQKVKIDVPGVGQVCGFSSFDFNAFEDENWVGREINSAYPNNSTTSVHNSLPSRPKARHGKMEKSFFSFKASHPNWTCTLSGQQLVNRVEKFQQEQARTLLAQERHHRILAANRELETLRLLQLQGSLIQAESKNTNMALNIKETYVANGQGVVLDNSEKPEVESFVFPTSNVDKNRPSDLDHSESIIGSNSIVERNIITEGEEPKESKAGLDNSIISASGTTSFHQSENHSTGTVPDVSVLHYADTALSTELRRMLNKSVLELGNISGIGSTLMNSMQSYTNKQSTFGAHQSSRLPKISDEDAYTESDNQLEFDHYWLDQYHSQILDSKTNIS